MNLKISVIIPIFNVRSYIDECLQSVLNQSYDNLEIILVDDGSTDDSPIICDNYAKEYSNIKVIHKQNGGLSDARNVGIKMATGDYILFLDADDFWNDDLAVQKLTDRIMLTKADLLNFSFVKYYEDTKKYVSYFKNVEPLSEELDERERKQILLDNNLYIASAWNKLIKKSLFDAGDLFFKRGIFSEDIDWCLRLLIKAEKVDFICENFYCYRQRSGSITHTITDKKCNDLADNIINCVNIVKQSPIMQDELLKYVSYQYGTFFITQALANHYQKENIERLSYYKWLLKYHGTNRKLSILYIMTSILGYTISCKLIRFFIQIRR